MLFNSTDIPDRAPAVEQFLDQFLSAVCDSSRRHILECLSTGNGEEHSPRELPAGIIAHHVGLAASTTSEHLKQLTSLNLLTSRREGKKIYYRLRNRDLVQTFQAMIFSLEKHYHANLLPAPAEGAESAT